MEENRHAPPRGRRTTAPPAAVQGRSWIAFLPPRGEGWTEVTTTDRWSAAQARKHRFRPGDAGPAASRPKAGCARARAARPARAAAPDREPAADLRPGRPSEREQATIDITAATSAAWAILGGEAEVGSGTLAGTVAGGRRGSAASRAARRARDGTATPPEGGALSRLAYPPAVLCMMADFWKARLAELDRAVAAETGPERLASLALDRMCVRGILAGLGDR